MFNAEVYIRYISLKNFRLHKINKTFTRDTVIIDFLAL